MPRPLRLLLSLLFVMLWSLALPGVASACPERAEHMARMEQSAPESHQPAGHSARAHDGAAAHQHAQHEHRGQHASGGSSVRQPSGGAPELRSSEPCDGLRLCCVTPAALPPASLECLPARAAFLAIPFRASRLPAVALSVQPPPPRG